MMGGGGAMKAAATKVAGVGAVYSGLRGFSSALPVAEQSVRNTSRNVHAAIRTSSQQTLKVDDLQLAGDMEDYVFNSVESTPRLVFGGVPSLHEAKAATAELKYALECVENKFSVADDSVVTQSVANHAQQAFRLLQEGPVAKNVVAAIAVDPNVWNAVLQNESLKTYIMTNKTSATPRVGLDATNTEEEHVGNAGCQDEEFEIKMDDTKKVCQCGNYGIDFTQVMQNMKHKLIDMVNSVSVMVNDFFGAPQNEDESEIFDRVGASGFMALAVLVIMVVVLRRA